VPIATRQPSSTSPTTFATAVRAPSRNVSLNSECPVICTIGRISMPGCCIGTRRYDKPRCFGASGFVRASTKIQCAQCASDVHTFWPVITHSSPSRAARVLTFARSEPASGSE
jgi:hypothetical protein